MTYGFSPQSMCAAATCAPMARGSDLPRSLPTVRPAPATVPDVFLPMFGQHNVQNALAALAVAAVVGIDDQIVRRAFDAFRGVNRRFAPAKSTVSS